MDTYHDDIIAFYTQLGEDNLNKIHALTIPDMCQRCLHRTRRSCDIAKTACVKALDICVDAGWYESGVQPIPELTNTWRDEVGNRHTKSTGMLAEESGE